MADAVVHVKVADLEPFKLFIAKVAEAHAHFYRMTPEDAQALPDCGVRAYAALTEALYAVGAGPLSSVHDDARRQVADQDTRQPG